MFLTISISILFLHPRPLIPSWDIPDGLPSLAQNKPMHRMKQPVSC